MKSCGIIHIPLEITDFSTETTRDHVEPNAFGYKLDAHRVNDQSTLFNPKSKYYLVTSVFRSLSIGINAEKGNKKYLMPQHRSCSQQTSLQKSHIPDPKKV
jgi:hypothetical protein